MTTYYQQWDAWDYAEVSAVDVNATTLADEATLTTDEIVLDEKEELEVGIVSTEDNTGACDGDVLVYVLGYTGGVWQTINDNPDLGCVIDQVQNTTRYGHFSVSAKEFSSVKILVDNDCGQEVALTIQYRRATGESV